TDVKVLMAGSPGGGGGLRGRDETSLGAGLSGLCLRSRGAIRRVPTMGVSRGAAGAHVTPPSAGDTIIARLGCSAEIIARRPWRWSTIRTRSTDSTRGIPDAASRAQVRPPSEVCQIPTAVLGCEPGGDGCQSSHHPSDPRNTGQELPMMN